MLQQITQSQEFKRTSANVADSGVKLFFKWLGIAVNGLVSAVVALFNAMIGK